MQAGPATTQRRPMTSGGGSSAGGWYAEDEEEEELDEESEDEDVFAFGVPEPEPEAEPEPEPPTEVVVTPDSVGYRMERLNLTSKGSSISESASTSLAPSIKMDFDFDAIEEEDSPYPEVRASVSNIDDPEMPAMTFRMWVVGLTLCMLSAALNVFFNFRSPAPSVVPNALLLLSYPMGKLLSFVLPITTYRIPLPGRRSSDPSIPPPSFSFSLNPGPWNIKEHGLVFIMANVAISSPYAINAIVVSEVFYDQIWGYWFSLVLVLATQLTGFGLAGVCRRFLVWPASMVWPQNLVACTLLNTLHAEEDGEFADEEVGVQSQPSLTHDAPRPSIFSRIPFFGSRKRPLTRYRFFLILTFFNFLFFFLPGFLFQALSIFSFVCWAAPDNVVVNQLFGVYSGMGMSVLTADWTEVGSALFLVLPSILS